MGINTLLPTLKPTFKSYETLENLRGQTAAIDIMVWLYKGAYSCSYELATGQATIEFLTYPLRMLRLLKNYQITPICVFDGHHLLAKKLTEEARIAYKQKNREQGQTFDKDGN